MFYNIHVIIINIYVKIVNLLYKLTSFISKSVRNLLLSFSCFSMSLWYVVNGVKETKDFLDSIAISGHHLYHSHVFCFFLVLLLISSVEKEIKETKCNKNRIILFILFPFSIFINKLTIEILPELFYSAVEWLIIFPCLYIVWNERNDYDRLFINLAISMNLAIDLYYINCWLVAKKGIFFAWNAFYATMRNPNILGVITMMGIISSIYILCRKSNSIILKLYSYVSIAISFVFVFLSSCRSAFLVIISSFIIVAVYFYKEINKNNIIELSKEIFENILVIVIFTTLIFYATNIMIKINNEAVNKRVDISMKENINYTKDKISLNNKNLNRFGSDRLNIWEAYLTNIDFCGHDCFDYAYTNPIYRAHNNFIEVFYFLGVISGIIYLFFAFMIAKETFVLLFKEKRMSTEDMFVLLISIGFAIEAMIEVALEIEYQPIVLSFYLVIAPYFIDKKKSINHLDKQ